MRWPRGILQPAGEIRDRSFEQQRYRGQRCQSGDGRKRALEHGAP